VPEAATNQNPDATLNPARTAGAILARAVKRLGGLQGDVAQRRVEELVQASILNLLAELQATEGVSYIFISHDLAVVRYLSDRIAVMYFAKLMELGGAEEIFTPPHHPCTEALMSAIPTLDFDHPSERIPLGGPVPSLSAPPSGCRFHTRYHRFLGDLCVNETPPWREVAPGHNYLCHIEPDELRELQLAQLRDRGAR
jgi:peptide/nickel transport system ATP-binding protein